MEAVRRFLVLFCCLFFGIILSPVFSSCGSATCPLDSNRDVPTGKWRVGLTYDYIDQSAAYVGSARSFPGSIPQHHDEVQTVNQRWTLSSQWAATDRWCFFAELPLVQTLHRHIHNHHNFTEIIPESWNFTGLGDFSIGSRYVVYKGETTFDPVFSVSSALKLPTGVPNMSSPSGGEAEVGIQPGSGSFDTTWGLHYSQTIGTTRIDQLYSAWPVFASFLYTFYGNGTNGWKVGNRWIASLGTAFNWTKETKLGIQINGTQSEKSSPGSTGENVANTGGRWIYVSPSIQHALTDSVELEMIVQIPLYREVNGIQITSDLNFRMGLTTTF